MVICDRLRELRESKNLSQGDIEKRTGLLRCYISRVENGTRFPPSKPWKSLHGLWKCRCINFSTTVTNRLSFRISLSGRHRTTSFGEVRARTRCTFTS
jgi:hypothetical protein